MAVIYGVRGELWECYGNAMVAIHKGTGFWTCSWGIGFAGVHSGDLNHIDMHTNVEVSAKLARLGIE